jgi:transglutaminase-like putative cysteine protease
MASHRRTAAAAFAVILASVSLYPVFIGLLWFWAGCGAVIVVALAGTLSRLRRLPVAVVLVIGVAALLLYLNFAFANGSSFLHLLPTPSSLAALSHAAGQGFNEASKYAPPVPELRGLVLLSTAGIGIAALLTDLIAVRLGSAALAGLPLLLLFTEPFTLSLSRGFVGTTVAFCLSVAGYLALLSSEGRDRIREWEHANPSGKDEPDTRTLAAAGRRVGFASVVVALCLPLFVPGLHSTRLFGGGQPGIGGSGGGGGGSGSGTGNGVGFPDPDTQLSQELHSTTPSNVLVYTTKDTSPDYLQIYTLDQLTDSGWRVSQPESLVPVSPRLPPPPGLTSTSSGTRVSTTITLAGDVGQDDLGALPVPYPATTVTASGTLRADRSTLMVFDTDVSLAGLKYTVTSLTESPPQQLLGAAPAPPADIAAHYLSVPSSYDSLKDLAQSVVRAAGAKNQFTDAVALQNWLANGAFRYTLKAPTVASASGLANFLEVTKKGYCQQFSFAMAVLARLLGIPSRVAIGYTWGTPVSGDTWLVTTHDAHAWPELYFQGYGWLRFEPTPTGTNGQGTAYAPGYSLGLVNPLTTGQPQTGLSAGPGSAQTGSTGIPENLRNLFAEHAGGGSAPVTAKNDTLSPWEIFGLVVAGLIVVAAIAPWCARRVVRRRRWRRLASHRARGATAADRVQARDVAWAHAAWEELRDDLTDYGASTLPSESPRAVAARAGTGLSLADPARAALGRIVMAEERARYAPAPTDGSGLRADSAAVRRAIDAAVPRGARWRARLLPASVLGPTLGAIASAADLYRSSREPRRRARQSLD